MNSIHIRNIEDETYIALKRLADRHKRSLQKEILWVLTEAAQKVQKSDIRTKQNKLQLNFAHSENHIPFSRSDIYQDDSR